MRSGPNADLPPPDAEADASPPAAPVVIRLSRWARLDGTLCLLAAMATGAYVTWVRQGWAWRWWLAFIAVTTLMTLWRMGFIVWGRRDVVIIDDDGVRWRGGPFLTPYSFTPWREIQVVRLGLIQAGKGSAMAISLVGPDRKNRAVIFTEGLEPPLEAALDAFRPYVFVQDLRPHR